MNIIVFHFIGNWWNPSWWLGGRPSGVVNNLRKSFVFL